MHPFAADPLPRALGGREGLDHAVGPTPSDDVRPIAARARDAHTIGGPHEIADPRVRGRLTQGLARVDRDELGAVPLEQQGATLGRDVGREALERGQGTAGTRGVEDLGLARSEGEQPAVVRELHTDHVLDLRLEHRLERRDGEDDEASIERISQREALAVGRECELRRAWAEVAWLGLGAPEIRALADAAPTRDIEQLHAAGARRDRDDLTGGRQRRVVMPDADLQANPVGGFEHRQRDGVGGNDLV
ncbi:MAG: hypothetical protein U0168_17825 [Nannocystaceae bacterium]